MIINKTLKALLKNNPKDPKEPLSDGTGPSPAQCSKLLTPWLVADFILRNMQPQIPMPWIFWNEPAEPQLDSVRHISWTLHRATEFLGKCSPACSSLSAFQAEQQTKLEMTAPMMIPTVGSSSQFSMQHSLKTFSEFGDHIFKRGHRLLYQSDIFLLGSSQSQKSERLVTGETCDNMFQSRNHQTDTNRHCPGSAFARTEQHWAALSSTKQHWAALSSTEQHWAALSSTVHWAACGCQEFVAVADAIHAILEWRLYAAVCGRVVSQNPGWIL